MPAREELRQEWEDAPDDPPERDVMDALIASEMEGIVHLRVRSRQPTADGEGELAPTQAWLSAPSTAWRAGEPTGAAVRDS
ncbi:hypothetical protein [Halolamina sp. C58]|uniref:hypothetical protein n=1 Tax=Halolamina sp. C58 TaxID=3421640 RepID=UPI003EB73CF8